MTSAPASHIFGIRSGPPDEGQTGKGTTMKRYVCKVCGYVYNPKAGIPVKNIRPRTAFNKLPADWVCPECSAKKDQFSLAR